MAALFLSLLAATAAPAAGTAHCLTAGTARLAPIGLALQVKGAGVRRGA